MKADDGDLPLCLGDEEKCPCGEIHYSILAGNEDNLFHIDAKTGDIEFLPQNHILRDDITLTIGAENDFPTLQESQTTLQIHFEPLDKISRYDFDVDESYIAGRQLLSLDEDVHSRRRRSVPVVSF